ncbi:hypothetical protein CFOL_v3_18594 [Cephalotus follicularis]|uniref:Uncharacterized protein n=1 Tax=Cephalotus follicularis TaxID=3775 RepID=A0A1Q3C4F2_CEPFO|nr:hypothetical protein CFOL_v3_18594 [Cephalotus follicularis]
MSASASGLILTWQANSTFPTVMAQMCSSWTATTSSISHKPFSSLVASISLGVLSIRTSKMFRSMLIVVTSTIAENMRVHIKSTIFHSGLYHMIAPPIITPRL